LQHAGGCLGGEALAGAGYGDDEQSFRDWQPVIPGGGTEGGTTLSKLALERVEPADVVEFRLGLDHFDQPAALQGARLLAGHQIGEVRSRKQSGGTI
jgi:hypothetical protein